jgi:hypothetical protein
VMSVRSSSRAREGRDVARLDKNKTVVRGFKMLFAISKVCNWKIQWGKDLYHTVWFSVPPFFGAAEGAVVVDAQRRVATPHCPCLIRRILLALLRFSLPLGASGVAVYLSVRQGSVRGTENR